MLAIKNVRWFNYTRLEQLDFIVRKKLRRNNINWRKIIHYEGNGDRGLQSLRQREKTCQWSEKHKMPWWKLASSWSSLVWSLARRSNIKTGIDLTMERRYHKKQMPRDVVVPETHPKKESGVVNILEKMVKTKARKIAGGLLCTRNLSWLHGKYNETINHFLAGCTVLAPNEYLARHNRPLMILAVEWAKPKELII